MFISYRCPPPLSHLSSSTAAGLESVASQGGILTTVPSGRMGATAVIYGHCLTLFGGTDGGFSSHGQRSYEAGIQLQATSLGVTAAASTARLPVPTLDGLTVCLNMAQGMLLTIYMSWT